MWQKVDLLMLLLAQGLLPLPPRLTGHQHVQVDRLGAAAIRDNIAWCGRRRRGRGGCGLGIVAIPAKGRRHANDYELSGQQGQQIAASAGQCSVLSTTSHRHSTPGQGGMRSTCGQQEEWKTGGSSAHIITHNRMGHHCGPS